MLDILNPENLMFMLKGAGFSLLLAFGAILFGCVIGVIMAAGKMSRSRLLNALASAYVEIFREPRCFCRYCSFISVFRSFISGLPVSE